MSSHRLDLTGVWEGTYFYPNCIGPTTPFVAKLADENGRLSGTTMEPNIAGFPGEADKLQAVILGLRHGRSVDFVKTYDGQTIDDNVDYVGQLSDDGSAVTGVWSNCDMDGTFEMYRDLEQGDFAEQEQQEEVPVATPIKV